MIDIQGDLLWAQADTLRGLYDELAAWQAGGARRRLRSLTVERDGDAVCAIGLVGPQATVLTSRDGTDSAVIHDGRLLAALG